MKPYGSGHKKKIDLKKRLYDSGISYYPMPSVVRPIETNSGVKSFMANTNAPRLGKGKDKSKGRFQNDMSMDYIRESQIPSMKGNMSMEYDAKDFSAYGAHNTMLSKAYGDSYGDISMQQERIKRAMRGQPNLNQSITGIKTASELKPALQVKQSSRLIGKGSFRAGSGLRNKLPPVKATSKTGLDVEHSPDKSASMIQEPYGYEEYKYSTASMVPMTDKAKSTIFSCPLEWKKRKVEITKIRAGEEDFEEDDFERAGTGPMGARAGRAEAQDLTDLKQVQSAVNNKEWVDLDKYIELLLDSKSEDEIVFIY